MELGWSVKRQPLRCGAYANFVYLLKWGDWWNESLDIQSTLRVNVRTRCLKLFGVFSTKDMNRRSRYILDRIGDHQSQARD
jgi:hypothetical protein